MRTPLRRKILLSSSSVLVILILTTLAFVSLRARRFVTDSIQSELVQGRDRVKTVEAERLGRLELTATLVASQPSFFAALRETNRLTVRDVLMDLQSRTGTTLFIALNSQREVVARTDTQEPLPVSVDLETTILRAPSGTYHVRMKPADSTGDVLGYVVAGLLIDEAFARDLKGNGNDDVVIAGDTILGSTTEPSKLPSVKLVSWEKAVGAEMSPQTVVMDGEDYRAVGTFLGGSEGGGPFVAVIQSYDQAIKPYASIQIGLLILGLIGAVVGVATSAELARRITAPVAKLVEGTRQVAEGNFDYRLDVPAADEIGDLALSFNTMIQGLRERADMKKFVSLSTVEMIQSSQTKRVSAGEKKVLTILFSDMRGFTSMTENATPEETVKLLNTCLSLQAARVKKFNGDIDKYVGDCVVALFSGDDMELNAIRCALETHRALDEWNASNAQERPIRVGIGIVTGEVILGSIGSEDRLDYTVIGSNVNLCSRLCSHAGPGETLLGESTYNRVQGLVAAQKADPLRVKGFTEPISVYKMS